jgi:hypothetical protein
MFEGTKRLGIPPVITFTGGYAELIECTAQTHANTFRTAVRVFRSEMSDRLLIIKQLSVEIGSDLSRLGFLWAGSSPR